MNRQRYAIVHKLLRDCRASFRDSQPRILIIGDEKQSVYGFLGSDVRFLTSSSWQ